MTSQERRELSFSNFEAVIEEISNLAAGNARTTGNHSFGRIVQHLAIANNMVVGKIKPPKLPFFMRMLMPLIKGSILNKPAAPGFKLPSSDMQNFFWPEAEIEPATALENFKQSVALYETEGPLPVHPVFGKATKEQVHNLLMSHAAMHLSFVHPTQTRSQVD